MARSWIKRCDAQHRKRQKLPWMTTTISACLLYINSDRKWYFNQFFYKSLLTSKIAIECSLVTLQTKCCWWRQILNWSWFWRSQPNNVIWRLTGAATWWTGRNIRVVFDSDLFPPLYGNMTSSTKPEVHNVSHSLQGRTEPRPQVTCTNIW